MAQPIQNLELESGEFGPVDSTEPQLSPSASENIINQLIGQALAPAGAEQPADAYMNDVDMRLEVASYYRELLKAPMFNEATEASLIVEKQIRDFVRNQLGILFGIQPVVTPITVVKSPFNELETATLQDLAALKPIEITALKMVLAQVIKATHPPDTKAEVAVRKTNAPEVKPTPTITPRQGPQAAGRPQQPQPAPVAPAPVKRGPGRPPKETITVIDPTTNQPRELKVVKEQVKNTRGIPMPTGAALFRAQTMAAQASVDNMENKPEAAQVLRATGN